MTRTPGVPDPRWEEIVAAILGELRRPKEEQDHAGLAAFLESIMASPDGRTLLDRLERGEEPAPLDAELDRRLADLVPEPMKTQVHDDLEGELEAFRSRMSPERFEATRRRASARRLRRLLDLPRLAEPESSD